MTDPRQRPQPKHVSRTELIAALQRVASDWTRFFSALTSATNDRDAVRSLVQAFQLPEAQARAVLDQRLRQLTTAAQLARSIESQHASAGQAALGDQPETAPRRAIASIEVLLNSLASDDAEVSVSDRLGDKLPPTVVLAAAIRELRTAIKRLAAEDA